MLRDGHIHFLDFWVLSEIFAIVLVRVLVLDVALASCLDISDVLFMELLCWLLMFLRKFQFL